MASRRVYRVETLQIQIPTAHAAASYPPLHSILPTSPLTPLLLPLSEDTLPQQVMELLPPPSLYP